MFGIEKAKEKFQGLSATKQKVAIGAAALATAAAGIVLPLTILSPDVACTPDSCQPPGPTTIGSTNSTTLPCPNCAEGPHPIVCKHRAYGPYLGVREGGTQPNPYSWGGIDVTCTRDGHPQNVRGIESRACLFQTKIELGQPPSPKLVLKCSSKHVGTTATSIGGDAGSELQNIAFSNDCYRVPGTTTEFVHELDTISYVYAPTDYKGVAPVRFNFTTNFAQHLNCFPSSAPPPPISCLVVKCVRVRCREALHLPSVEVDLSNAHRITAFASATCREENAASANYPIKSIVIASCLDETQSFPKPVKQIRHHCEYQGDEDTSSIHTIAQADCVPTVGHVSLWYTSNVIEFRFPTNVDGSPTIIDRISPKVQSSCTGFEPDICPAAAGAPLGNATSACAPPVCDTSVGIKYVAGTPGVPETATVHSTSDTICNALAGTLKVKLCLQYMGGGPHTWFDTQCRLQTQEDLGLPSEWLFHNTKASMKLEVTKACRYTTSLDPYLFRTRAVVTATFDGQTQAPVTTLSNEISIPGSTKPGRFDLGCNTTRLVG